MPVPWISLIDVALGLTDVVRRMRGSGEVKGRALAASSTVVPRARDTRLAGVMMSALREAFDRDHERHELERQRAEDERLRAEEDRLRAERALRLEGLRQAGDREIGRMRLLFVVALAGLLLSLLLMTRQLPGTGARVSLGVGWVFIVLSMAQSFGEQGRVARMLAMADDRLNPDRLTSGASTLALGLLFAGLALVASSVLFT